MEMDEAKKEEYLERLSEKVVDRLRHATTEDLTVGEDFVSLVIVSFCLKDDE